MDNLDKLFGDARPELFEKAEVVDKITGPDTLIETLKKAGINPWDYLNLSVKRDMDTSLIKKTDKGIETAEAILPKRGLLAKLPNLVKAFSEEAKLYLKEYLKLALRPTVVLGTKNNKKSE